MEGGGIDCSDGKMKGDFEEVEAAKENGRGAEEIFLGQAHGEKIEGHDRAGGVGGHGGESGGGAGADNKPPGSLMGILRGRGGGGEIFAEVKKNQDKEDEADQARNQGIRGEPEDEKTNYHPKGGGGE